ncbi:hypothetical protein HHI36_011553 [Cryptolaemus montrouzieri]|uniref:Uncharacterized protein n=1 Tax=Cryptolaemus montrouzieri TaxID=559131 RepID=A0ABD2MM40_9CUCU
MSKMKYVKLYIVLVLTLICQYVKSQDYNDFMNKLFRGSAQSYRNPWECPDYDCNCPYPCQVYDSGCDDQDVEVIYLSPKQYANIFDFIHKRLSSSSTTRRSTTDRDIEVLTTQNPTTTTEIRRVEETTTYAPSKETTTLRLPIEDINYNIMSGSEPTLYRESTELVTTTKIETETIKKASSPNEYDDYDERDSEEDRNSVKEPEIPPDVQEDENSSKPKNIDSWFKF